MRKLLTLATSLALVGSLALSSCGTSANPGPTVTSPQAALSISVWVDADREASVTSAGNRFTADTGVGVVVQVKKPENIIADFTAQATSPTAPDAIIATHDQINVLAREALLAPIDLDKAATEVMNVARQAVSYQGQTYGLPSTVETLALIRNTKLAPDAPANWDAAVAAGRAANVPFPILIGGDDPSKASPYNLYPFQSSFGAALFQTGSDGSADLTRLAMGGEPGAAYVTWLAAQSQAGVLKLSITAEVAINEFIAGNSPFIVAGSHQIKKIAEAGLSYAIDPLPSAGAQPATPFVSVQAFAVNAHSAKQAYVQQFLTGYLAAAETLTAMGSAAGQAPASSPSPTPSPSRGSTDLSAFAQIAQGGVPLPVGPEMATVWTDWGTAVTEIVGQRTTDPVGTWQAMVTALQAKLG